MICSKFVNKLFDPRIKFTIVFFLCAFHSFGQINVASCNEVEPWVNTPFDNLKDTITDGVIGFPICVGAIVNTSNIVNTNTTDFAEIDFDGLGCEVEIAVKDNATDTYPAGTFAGFEVSADGFLAGTTIASEVTISIYNNGTFQEAHVAVSVGVGVDASLLTNDDHLVLGFISTLEFDEIRINYDALIAGNFNTKIYHAVIQKFCVGTSLACNVQENMTNSDYPVTISQENTGISNFLCATCSIDNIENLINSNISDFATIILEASVTTRASLAVKDVLTDYSAGDFAGFDISNPNLIGANLLSGIIVRTFKDGVLQESSTDVGRELVSSGSTLISGDNRQVIGFITTLDFDEVVLVVSNGLGILNTTNVYSAIFQTFCAGQSLVCNEIAAISSPDYPLYINNANTGISDLACTGCSIDNPNNVINSNTTDFAQMILAAGVNATASLAVKDQLDTYAAGTFTGFDIENPNLLNAGILDNITICTFLDGVSVECKSGTGSLVSTATSILTDDGRRTVGFLTTGAFDEVQFNLDNLAGADVGITNIFGAVFGEFCNFNMECDTSYFLLNPTFPILINGARTGIEGAACVGSSVEDAPAILTTDTLDHAIITVDAGATCSGSIAVVNPLTTYPKGSTAGFVIEVDDPLLINLGLTLFNSIEICTYKDDIEQECFTGIDLVDAELVVLFINDEEGRYNVGFRVTKSYDEVEMTINSLATVTNEVKVYSAFIDTKGAYDDGFDCCPIDAPTFSSNPVASSCPDKTVDLTALVTGSLPLYSTIEWYDNQGHILPQIADPTMAPEGTYYAFYFDSVNVCYTPVSLPLVVNSEACVDMEIEMEVDTPSPFFGEEITISLIVNNNGPDDGTGVNVADLLPTGYSYVSSTSTSGTYNNITGAWDVGDVANGTSDTLFMVVTINPVGDYTNVATVSGDVTDLNQTNNSAQITLAPTDACNPTGQPVAFDCDNDGLTNYEEITGLDDPETIANPNGISTDPHNPDSDGDGVIDGTEAIDGTNPNIPCDFNPQSLTLPPDIDFQQLDCDGDGVINSTEATDSTDVLDPCVFLLASVTKNAADVGDCDGDGVSNADEINGLDGDYSTLGDNTNVWDSCSYNPIDQNIDSVSVTWLMADCDLDGVTNGNEVTDGTNPQDPCSLLLASVSMNAMDAGDCDGDGVINSAEINGTDGDFSTTNDNTDPNDACDYNPIDVTKTVTADQSNCNSLISTNDINVTLRNYPVSGVMLTNDQDVEGNNITLDAAYNKNGNPLNTNGGLNFLPGGATLQIFPNGTYSYNPPIGFTGSDEFSYAICDDGLPQECDLSVVTIDVIPPASTGNDAPLANNDTGQTPNNAVLTGNISSNDTDADGDALLVSTSPIISPNNGNVVLSTDGTFVYTPNPGFIGRDSVTYEVCDDAVPALCDEALLVIVVTDTFPPNEMYANDDVGTGFENVAMTIDLLANDTDPEGDSFSNPTIVSGPDHGDASINPDGTLTFLPENNYQGNDEIVYSVCDNGSPSVCDTSTLYLTLMESFCFAVDMKIYLEGALKNNGGAVGSGGEPLMRDDLRSSPYADTLGTNFIPVNEPFTSLSGFTHYGSGGGEVAGVNAFDDRGQNSVIDWVLIEMRNKFNPTDIKQTRSAFVQRDGDIVDVDGVSPITFCGLTGSSYFIAIKHRNHFGVMTATVENLATANLLIDFTDDNLGLSGVFNFGTGLGNGLNYSGLSQKTIAGVRALWSGNANMDGKIKYQGSFSDRNKILSDVLSHPGNSGVFDFNFDKGYGYYQGDLNMDSKVKYQGSASDRTFLVSYVLSYALNAGIFDYNFDEFRVQLPEE